MLLALMPVTEAGLCAQSIDLTPEQEAEARRVLESIPSPPAASPAASQPSGEASAELRRFLRDEKRRLEIGRLEAEMRRVIAERAVKAAKRRGEAGLDLLPLTPLTDHPNTPESRIEPASPGAVDPVPLADSVRKAREERLEELSKRKGTMSAEEYQRRRIEILLEEQPE